jgi:RHH-type rel operon transcriptional repressor/antitoxin RelB
MTDKNLIALRIDKKMNDKLSEVATMLDRSKSWLIRQSIESYLDDLDDILVAEKRLRDPKAEYVDLDDLKKELNLN